MLLSHEWEDISRHGSPEWECRYCGISRTKLNSAELCNKTTSVKINQYSAEEEVRILKLEELEYKRIRYLLDKFEKGYG